MKLRLGAGGTGLMLSSGNGHWCRIDAGAVDVARDAPVVLTGSLRKQVGGLLDLRHAEAPLQVYATPAVFEHLTHALPLLAVLDQFRGVQWHVISVAGEQRQAAFVVEPLPTLSFTALADADGACGERIALAVRDEHSGARLFFAAGDSLDDAAIDWMRGADCIVLGGRCAARAAGWADRLAPLTAAHKLLLDAPLGERVALERSGFECADAALEIAL